MKHTTKERPGEITANFWIEIWKTKEITMQMVQKWPNVIQMAMCRQMHQPASFFCGSVERKKLTRKNSWSLNWKNAWIEWHNKTRFPKSSLTSALWWVMYRHLEPVGRDDLARERPIGRQLHEDRVLAAMVSGCRGLLGSALRRIRSTDASLLEKLCFVQGFWS